MNFHNKINYRPDIDGLRAIAVLSVVLFHAFPRYIPGGYIGVDIFYVISGYLITSILINRNTSGAVLEFYINRIHRIYPALLVILLAVSLAGWFVLFPHEYKQLGTHIAGASSFVLNLILYAESGYFDINSINKPLLNLWSLSIEEQFYIIWPFIILLFKSRSRRATIFLVLCAISLMYSIWLTYDNMSLAFYSPLSRAWELLSGSILALYGSDSKNIPTRNSNIAAYIGIFTLLIGLFAINDKTLFPGIAAILPVTSAILLIYSGIETTAVKRFLAGRTIVYIGTISYSLYLWHWPVLSFLHIFFGQNPPRLYRIVAVLISFILAAITYQFIEKPLRLNKSRKITYGLCVLILLFFIFGLVVRNSNGFPSRQDFSKYLQGSYSIIPTLEDDPIEHDKCTELLNISYYVRYCKVSNFDIIPSIVIIGDSHASSLYSGLKEVLPNSVSVANVGGRVLYDVDVFPKGNAFEKRVNDGGIRSIDFVAKNNSFKFVVIAARQPISFEPRSDVTYKLRNEPNVGNIQYIYEKGIRNTLDLLTKSKKEIIFVLDNPQIDFDPYECVERPFKRTTFNCAITYDKYVNHSLVYRNLIKKILVDYPNVKIFDSEKYFCDGKFCYASDNNGIMYSDDNHLSHYGSKKISEFLVKEYPRLTIE